MGAAAAIEAGRRAAERLMTDSYQVFFLDVDNADPLTGEATRVLVYEGIGKLQSWEGYEQSRDLIGHTTTVQRLSLHLPIGEYRPKVGHVAVCVASMDSNLVGTEHRIAQDAPFKTSATAYRVFVDYKAD